MLDDATLELTHCAMDNTVLTLMSGPLGVRPHYLFGDLVINAEAIVDVFNAKTIDPEDLSKTVILLPSTHNRSQIVAMLQADSLTIWREKGGRFHT